MEVAVELVMPAVSSGDKFAFTAGGMGDPIPRADVAASRPQGNWGEVVGKLRSYFKFASILQKWPIMLCCWLRIVNIV